MNNRITLDQLFCLSDAIADEILVMTEEEVISTLSEEGISYTDAVNAFNSILDGAEFAVKQNKKQAKLSLSRQNIIKKSREGVKTIRKLTVKQARAIIDKAQVEIPELTLAAQNKKIDEISDEEAKIIARSLIKLGYDPKSDVKK